MTGDIKVERNEGEFEESVRAEGLLASELELEEISGESECTEPDMLEDADESMDGRIPWSDDLSCAWGAAGLNT